VTQKDAIISLKRAEFALDTEPNEYGLNVRLKIVRILLSREGFVGSMVQSGRNGGGVAWRGVVRLLRVGVSVLVMGL